MSRSVENFPAHNDPKDDHISGKELIGLIGLAFAWRTVIGARDGVRKEIREQVDQMKFSEESNRLGRAKQVLTEMNYRQIAVAAKDGAVDGFKSTPAWLLNAEDKAHKPDSVALRIGIINPDGFANQTLNPSGHRVQLLQAA